MHFTVKFFPSFQISRANRASSSIQDVVTSLDKKLHSQLGIERLTAQEKEAMALYLQPFSLKPNLLYEKSENLWTIFQCIAQNDLTIINSRTSEREALILNLLLNKTSFDLIPMIADSFRQLAQKKQLNTRFLDKFFDTMKRLDPNSSKILLNQLLPLFLAHYKYVTKNNKSYHDLTFAISSLFNLKDQAIESITSLLKMKWVVFNIPQNEVDRMRRHLVQYTYLLCNINIPFLIELQKILQIFLNAGLFHQSNKGASLSKFTSRLLKLFSVISLADDTAEDYVPVSNLCEFFNYLYQKKLLSLENTLTILRLPCFKNKEANIINQLIEKVSVYHHQGKLDQVALDSLCHQKESLSHSVTIEELPTYTAVITGKM